MPPLTKEQITHAAEWLKNEEGFYHPEFEGENPEDLNDVTSADTLQRLLRHSIACTFAEYGDVIRQEERERCIAIMKKYGYVDSMGMHLIESEIRTEKP